MKVTGWLLEEKGLELSCSTWRATSMSTTRRGLNRSIDSGGRASLQIPLDFPGFPLFWALASAGSENNCRSGPGLAARALRDLNRLTAAVTEMTYKIFLQLPLGRAFRTYPGTPRIFPMLAMASMIVLIACLPGARAEEEILFIGNSFTLGDFGNATVPEIFDALARAGGQEPPVVVTRGVGGSDFEFHARDATTQAVISSRPWSHVVIQNYSTEPTHIGNVADHLTYGSQLYGQVMANSALTRVMLFETWSRAAAHPLISGSSTSTTFATANEMQSELRVNYSALAASLNSANPGNPPVKIAPVGDAWENAGGLLPASDPGFADLHASDDYHGDDNGYYLAAAVFYSKIYGASPRGLHASAEVAALGLVFSEDPEFLEQVAWGTVQHAPNVGRTWLVDFGSDRSPTLTGAQPNDPLNVWNNVTQTEGRVQGAGIPNLVGFDGVPTGVALTITRPFNRESTGGTKSSTNYPANASSDSLFGNTESHRGASNVFPAFTLSGLDPGVGYALTFHASQVGVGDNRETLYTVTGAGTSAAALNLQNNVNTGTPTTTVALNPSNNVDTEAVTVPVFPTAAGEIGVAISPGPNNNNNHHFTYLGAMKIQTAGASQLEFAVQPADQNVPEKGQARFVCAAAGTPPYSFQWFRNGVAINGATASRYTIPNVGSELDGSSYAVVVTDAVAQLTSDTAVLHVSADVDPPSYVVAALPGSEQIELVFSEALDPAGLLDRSGYRVANRGGLVPVLDAKLSPDGKVLTLTLGTALSGNYAVAVPAGLSDLAGNPVAADGALAFGVVPAPAGVDMRIDFGPSTTTTGAANDPLHRWNNVTESVGRSNTGVLPDLVGSDGTPTGVRLEMIDRFNGGNNNGTTSSPAFPGTASGDSLFGNTETWDGLANVFPAFRLRNLDPRMTCSLSFFASRINAGGDNRETRYTVVGAETASTVLSISDNIAGIATLANLRPDAGGNLTIQIDPGPNNNNLYHFTYLGVLLLSYDAEPGSSPGLFPPVPIAGSMFIDWTGQGNLETSPDLADPWTPVLPAPTAPYLEPMSDGGRRFFRLRYPEP